jgi:hypothetical protein
MRIMLRVLEQAFTEVVITPEDWVQLEKEAEANLQKGVTTGGDPSQGGGGDIKQQLMSLPPEIKQQAMQMKEQGMPDDQIKAFLMEAVQKQGGGQGAPPSAPEQQGAPQSAPQQQQTAV